MRLVETPRQRAIVRFWVAARTNSPRRVRASTSAMEHSTASEKPMMTMRFQGNTRLAASEIPPDIQEGFSTETFCAPKRLRAN